MTHAVHSIHARSVRLINGGYEIIPGTTIQTPEPIHTADTEEEAEDWRLGRLERWKEGRG